ncbi:MAG: HNH endonuclease [Trichodesmium sp. St18_bin1]|nr:HNH endonuclease [Trichodesmium sp. St18_bin1]MDE5121039.1 HNH endonuclease [Trichodesmium sp. St19_bin1]
MASVLVLNASYEPLNITSWRRAIVLLLKGKAVQIEHNGIYVLPDLLLPTVIRLRYYVRVPYKDIPLTRQNIMHRDGHSCQYCGYVGNDLTLDHVVPRSRGGGDTWDNLVTACVRCNVQKGNRTPKEANMILGSRPKKPYSGLYFELTKHLKSGSNKEWRKYVIGL